MATVHASAVVDADDVKEIIDTDLTDARINNFINMAYVATIPLSGKLGNCGGSYALQQIQLLLAAHFLTLYERTLKSENVAGEWSATYAIQEGMMLDASLYGQQAKALDCSGLLAKSGSKRAGFDVTSYYQLEDSTYLLDADIT